MYGLALVFSLCSATHLTPEEIKTSNYENTLAPWLDEDILYIPPQNNDGKAFMMTDFLMTSAEYACRIFGAFRQISIYCGSFILSDIAYFGFAFLLAFRTVSKVTAYLDPGAVANKRSGTLIPHEPRQVPLYWGQDNCLPSDVAATFTHNFEELILDLAEKAGGMEVWQANMEARGGFIFECALLCWKKSRRPKE